MDETKEPTDDKGLGELKRMETIYRRLIKVAQGEVVTLQEKLEDNLINQRAQSSKTNQ